MKTNSTFNDKQVAQRRQKNNELLLKGIFIGFIGLTVLLSPSFMSASGLRDTVAASYLVGWFALLLGGVFVAQYLARKAKMKP